MDAIGGLIVSAWLVTALLAWFLSRFAGLHPVVAFLAIAGPALAVLAFSDAAISPRMEIAEAASTTALLTWPAALTLVLRSRRTRRKAAS